MTDTGVIICHIVSVCKNILDFLPLAQIHYGSYQAGHYFNIISLLFGGFSMLRKGTDSWSEF